MAWIRLDTDFFTNDEICEMSIPVRYAVLGTLSYIKAHGGHGKVKATPRQIARCSDLSVNSVEEALECSMFQVEGKSIQVVNWQHFQMDPTNTDRQAAFRVRKKDLKKVTVTPVNNKSNGSNDYRTGQDRTGQDNNKVVFDIPQSLYTAEFKKVWDEWVKYRSEIKKPIKPTTGKKQLSMLAKYPTSEAISLLEKSMTNGWTGIFKDKNGNNRRKTKELPYTGKDESLII